MLYIHTSISYETYKTYKTAKEAVKKWNESYKNTKYISPGPPLHPPKHHDDIYPDVHNDVRFNLKNVIAKKTNSQKWFLGDSF